MRYQGYSSVGLVDEPESSAYVQIDRDNPDIYCDCSVEPSLTRQEFLDDCDINKLMAQYEKSGILPTVNLPPPRYLDVSDIPDLQQAMNILNDATTAFMTLPASVRRDFDNDALKFVAFAENPDNIEKMREWKLAPPAPTEPAPARVLVVNPESDSALPEPPKPAPKA